MLKDNYVLACFENPGHGGASTASYALFEMMQERGLPVSYLSLIDRLDQEYYTAHWETEIGNPRNLSNVHTVFLQNATFQSGAQVEAVLAGIAPGIVIAIGFVAGSIVEATGLPFIYVTSGCDQVKRLIASKAFSDALSVRNALERQQRVPRLENREFEVLERAQYVITHSEDTLHFFQKLFPEHLGKIHPRVISFAEWIIQEAAGFARYSKPFEQRSIDLLFIASSWTRPEKNYDLVLDILSSRKQLSIHVIGEMQRPLREFNQLEQPKILASAHFDGHISDRARIFQLMGDAKTIVSTSRYDAAPGILFEGAMMGCNLVASMNCGNWQICHPELLVEEYRLGEFLKRIDHSLSEKFADNLNSFLDQDAVSELTGLLRQFAE